MSDATSKSNMDNKDRGVPSPSTTAPPNAGNTASQASNPASNSGSSGPERNAPGAAILPPNQLKYVDPSLDAFVPIGIFGEVNGNVAAAIRGRSRPVSKAASRVDLAATTSNATLSSTISSTARPLSTTTPSMRKTMSKESVRGRGLDDQQPESSDKNHSVRPLSGAPQKMRSSASSMLSEDDHFKSFDQVNYKRVRHSSVTPSTYTQASRIMNAPASLEGAIEKAVFYNEIVDAYNDGVEDTEAFERASAAVREYQSANENAQETFSEYAIDQKGKSKSTIAEQNESFPVASRFDFHEITSQRGSTVERKRPTHRVHVEGSEIHANYDESNYDHPSWPPLTSSKHPKNADAYRKGKGAGNLKGLVENVIRPAIRDTLATPDIAGVYKPPDMKMARILFQKLKLTIDDYDYAIRADANESAREMLISYRKSIEAVETRTRKQVAHEFEKRINHDECNSKIAHMEKEIDILRSTAKSAINVTEKLQKEVDDLRVYKSSAEQESKILLADVAKRRLHCAALRRRLKASQQALEETEKYVGSLEAELAVALASNNAAAISGTPRLSLLGHLEGNESSRKWSNALKSLKRRLSKNGHRLEDEDGALSTSGDESDASAKSRPYSRNAKVITLSDAEEELKAIADSEEMSEGRDRISVVTKTKVESDEDVDIDEEEWEMWCKENDFRRPGWNKSTATNVLNQAPPPSVIHIGDNPLMGVADAVEYVTESASTIGASQVAAMSGAISAISATETPTEAEASLKKKMMRDAFLAKVHSKCRSEMDNLRRLIQNEKAAKKAALNMAPRKKEALYRLIDILEQVLEFAPTNPETPPNPNLSLSRYTTEIKSLLSTLTASPNLPNPGAIEPIQESESLHNLSESWKPRPSSSSRSKSTVTPTSRPVSASTSRALNNPPQGYTTYLQTLEIRDVKTLDTFTRPNVYADDSSSKKGLVASKNEFGSPSAPRKLMRPGSAPVREYAGNTLTPSMGISTDKALLVKHPRPKSAGVAVRKGGGGLVTVAPVRLGIRKETPECKREKLLEIMVGPSRPQSARIGK
ncbi:hypothetical protein HDV05_005185 [Chytridiales sp. JEL 0842]|nr:hypothetical protein HDV05_005185 [Chytridiales sp. JEL 0842]